MPAPRDRLAALEEAARERDLTPLAWWVGAHRHDDVLADLREAGIDLETRGGRLAAIDGREVKVLTESPDRLALWCEEGALDL